MKNILYTLSILILTASMAQAHAKKACCTGCPSQLDGAQTIVENTPDGVNVHITSKDPAVIKKIQESAVEHFKKDPTTAKAHKHHYVCPMGCGSSDKPGKCPKCGMEMKEDTATDKKK